MKKIQSAEREVEKKYKKKDKRKLSSMRVSGKSVQGLQKIIGKKGLK